MHLAAQLPLLLALSLAAAAEPPPASFIARHLDRAHHVALRHSAGLARDLRVAFAGVMHERRDVSAAHPQALLAQRPYCVSGGRGTSPANQGPGGSLTSASASGSTAHPSVTKSSGGKGSATAASTNAAAPAPTATQTSPWKLWKNYIGDSFFTDWDYFTGGDPTNGIVNYVDLPTAQKAGLARLNDAGNLIMGMETTGTVANTRQSVRITTKVTFDGALVVLDAVHMPTGCGTWPAFWTNGPNWPYQGEIDIVEGVNDYISNQCTVHTGGGCTIPSSAAALNITGTLVAQTNCAALDTGNQGCGMRAPDRVSFGAAFNKNGGGTYAMKWDEKGVSVYFFPPGSVPQDLTAETPLPGGWGAPVARWPADTCDPFKFFKGHSVIINTTACGDWAGSAWTGSGLPGQEQSCAARTGFSTCEAYVRANGAAFAEAYWEIRSVKIYQKSG